MVRLLLLVALALVASLGFSAPLPDGVTAQDVVSMLQQKGYQATIKADSDGDDMVKSRYSSHPFTVFFYQIDAQTKKAKSIEFAYAIESKGVDVADWNRHHRFARAYLDDEEDPNLIMDIDVEAGFTTESLDNNFERWFSVLDDFTEFLKP